jgi:hypothetical protein
MTVAQLLKHDFESKGDLELYDANGKLTYSEWSDGYWVKREFDSNGNKIYHENSDRYWVKREYDTNGNEIYYENSKGELIDKRPKKETCNGKVVEIDGKKYKLTEI